MMNRIVNGEETTKEEETRRRQQRINFIEACKRQRCGSCIGKLSYADIALALEYGVSDVTAGFHSIDLKNMSSDDMDILILFCSLEALLKSGADPNYYDVSSDNYLV
jgi:hypothetical protein